MQRPETAYRKWENTSDLPKVFYVTLTARLGIIFVNNQLLCSLIQTCTLNGHLYSVTYTRCRIDTINAPDDGHMAPQNM
jgi:hypothetical protein